MNRSIFSIIVYIIIGLAVIGLISQLVLHTTQFLAGILTTIAISLSILAVIYFVFLKKRAPSNDSKKYKQAVKQSKAKYKPNTSHTNIKTTTKSRPKRTQKLKRKKKHAPHLRVIDGNKQKGKDRASF